MRFRQNMFSIVFTLRHIRVIGEREPKTMAECLAQTWHYLVLNQMIMFDKYCILSASEQVFYPDMWRYTNKSYHYYYDLKRTVRFHRAAIP